MKYNYKPSLTELRSSLKYRSKEYLLENTLHGVPYFVDPTRPKWERLMWFLLTMSSVIAVFAIIVIILGKFETEPTITGLDIMTEHVDIEFPQIFICFNWAQLNHSRLHENNMYMYEQVYSWTWGKDINLGSLEAVYGNKNRFHSVFKMLLPDCNNLINNCAYRGVKVPCNKLFTKVLVAVGACCKLNAVEPLKIMDPSWNLDFEILNSSLPWRLYVTQFTDSSPQAGERPIVNVYYPVDIEFIVEITYATPDIRYLTLRQRKCYYRNEGVSLNDCANNCFIDMFFKRCNCLPWFLSAVDKTECPLSKYSCLNDSNTETSQCDCWLSCDHTSYNVRSIIKSADNINRIMLRNWPTALYKREMRFGYLDLLVSFGGIAGLFLGYSLLTSIELGYYFSLRTYCGAVIQSSRKKYNIVTVHVVEKLPQKVDVNPMYYQYID